jgi:hypothetical protein
MINNKKKFFLLSLLALSCKQKAENKNPFEDHPKIASLKDQFEKNPGIISETDSFKENYEKIISFITSESYQNQLSSPMNSGFFLNNIKPHAFEIRELNQLVEKTKIDVRNEKYNLIGAFELLESMPIEAKMDQKIQKTLINNSKSKITEMSVAALSANIDDKKSIPSILNALRSPIDSNMFLFAKHICNMPAIKEKINNPELENLIKNSHIEKLFKKNAFNKDLLLEKNIEYTDQQIEDLKKELLSFDKKINDTYSNIKKGIEYIKYIPISIDAFYKFVIDENSEKKARIESAKLREDADFIISQSAQNQIYINSAFKKIMRAMQESVGAIGGDSQFPANKQSIHNFLKSYGNALTEEEKEALYGQAIDYIFSHGIVLEKTYEPGTKFYNSTLANIQINNDKSVEEKLSFIIEHLFSTKKIKFSGKKVEQNNFNKNFNSFFQRNKLYEGFIDIVSGIKNISIKTKELFKNPQDIFALETGLALSEMIFALAAAKQTKESIQEKRIHFLSENPYATMYFNKNKNLISAALETTFLTCIKPILGSIMPYSIKEIETNQENKTILKAEKIYNIQTQKGIVGKLDLTGTELFFGPAGSGKSSLFKTLISAMQIAAFLGTKKTYVEFETNLKSVPKFIYGKNFGEINNQNIGAGLSNFQANMNQIRKMSFFIREYIDKYPILILDEVFSAGNPQTASGFVKLPLWRELMSKLMSTLIIEHNIDTLTATSATTLNVIGLKVVTKEGKTALAHKDLTPYEKTISQAEKEFLKQLKKDPRFYFMMDLKENKLVEVSEKYFNNNKGSSDNYFFDATFHLDRMVFTNPDHLNEEGDVRLHFYPQFHLIEPTKNVADSTIVFWSKLQPEFKKDEQGKIIDVNFTLLKEKLQPEFKKDEQGKIIDGREKENIPYFKVDSSNIETEGIFQILSQEINTKIGKNKTMTFFEDPILQRILNEYICKKEEVDSADYDSKLLHWIEKNSK